MEIRSAKPTDSGNIAELMYSAGPELYDFLYQTGKKTALDYIRYEFASGQGFCGHQNLTVAVQDGVVVATGCFYDGTAYQQLLKGSMANMFKFYGPLGIWSVLARSKHLGSVMTTPRRSELYLSNFGVSPDLRGTGIGSAMLESRIALARNAGYKTFSLDVATTNPRAEALYRSHGLSVVKEKTFTGKRAGMTMPDSRKMELVL